MVAHTANMMLPTNGADKKGATDTAAGPLEKPTMCALGPY